MHELESTACKMGGFRVAAMTLDGPGALSSDA